MELSVEKALKQQGYIMTYKCLIKELGTLEAVFLSELISKQKYFEDKNMLDDDGYFYCTYESINESTGIKRSSLETLREKLKELGLIDFKRKGIPKVVLTHGGVKRDLKRYDEALGLGEQAHLFTPQDFRPCTLLGAVNMEIGHYDLGQSWYGKAVKLGYSEKLMNDELRSIFMCAKKSKQEALRNHLLKMDSVRYSWVKNKPGNR